MEEKFYGWTLKIECPKISELYGIITITVGGSIVNDEYGWTHSHGQECQVHSWELIGQTVSDMLEEVANYLIVKASKINSHKR